MIGYLRCTKATIKCYCEREIKVQIYATQDFTAISKSESFLKRPAFLMLDDSEMPVKSEVAYLNELLNLNAHSKISNVLTPGNISKVLVLWKCMLS